MIVLAFGLLGLCFGSFVNAFVWRIHKKKDWVRERSICTHCKHILEPRDLVPVLSWLSLGGKCRYCHKKIDDSPLTELVTSTLFVSSYLFWPFVLNTEGKVLLGFWLIFLVGFVALALYDLKWLLLPNKILYPLIGLAAIQALTVAIVFDGGIASIRDSLLGILASSGAFYLLFQVSAGKWIGGGDVKLGILLGILLGGFMEGLMMIFIASLLGTLVSIPLLIGGKVKGQTRVPFGPFLMTATVIVYLWGPRLIDWYETLLLT